jgi:1-acyl-sn-glycerol-3-phosphate acyltransferase
MTGAPSPRFLNLTVTREREPLVNLLMYHAFKWSIVSPVFHTYWQGRVYGANNVPKKGPFLVVSNHASNYDPLILSCAMGRPMAYMAKAELFKVPVLNTAVRLYGAYPVKRGQTGSSSIKSALEYLANGWGAAVFLDGTRTPTGRILQPKSGAALVAAKAQVPVLMASLWGAERIESNGKTWPAQVPITLRIGEPQPPPASTKRDVLDECTALWAEKIEKMLDLGR